MTSPQEFLVKLYDNLHILEEREADYGGVAAPLWLINQIEHYREAIDLTEKAIDQDISVEELQTEFTRLNLEIRDTIEFKPARKSFDGRNPYRGLEKFTEDEHEFFFGRSAATAELMAMSQALIEAETTNKNPTLLAVIGASGSGKSSLVRAGLIPALREGHIPHSENWPIRVMLPGPKPIESLAQSFVKLTGRGLRSILDDLHRDEQGLHYLIKETLADAAENTYLTLVIDQFEELFTLCEHEEERQGFIKLLLYEATHRHHRGLTILTMRADFYGRASQYPELAQALTVYQMLVAPMTPRELREAILLPAEEVGLEMEKDLALALVQDTVNEPGALPLLQHTLLELFNRRSEENVLTMEAYQEIGGVRGALAHRADDVLNHLTPKQRELARNIFLRLTTLGEGVSDTRRRVSRQELYPAGADPEAINTVLQALSGKEARLVVTDEETVEVTHEALIQQWGQLREWLEENRDSLRIHRRVTEAAKEWQANERDDSYLFRGARLAEAEAWLEENKSSLTEIEQAFLEASSAEARRELKEARKTAATLRRRALIAGGVSVVAVIAAIVAAFFFFNAQESAQEAQRRADIAQAQALAANSLLIQNDDELQLLLAREAFSITTDAQARWLQDNALRTGLIRPYFSNILRGSESGSYSVAISEDGKILASGDTSPDYSIRVWDLNEPGADPIVLRGHEAWAYSVALSADGTTLASGSFDRTVRVWDLTNPDAEPTVLQGHEGEVNSVALSADGTTLASGSIDQTVRVWDLTDPDTEPTVLWKHSRAVNSVALSADGTILASGGDDWMVWVWDLTNPDVEPIPLLADPVSFLSVALSGDGSILAAGSADHTIRLWDLSHPGAGSIPLQGHEEPVSSVALSADGQTLISGSIDNTIRVWDLTDLRSPSTVLQGHEDSVYSLAVSADGQTLASGSFDQTRVWDLSQPRVERTILRGHESWVKSVAFSPDGQTLASGSADNTIRVWDLTNPGAEPIPLRGHESQVLMVAFSSDGQTLISGSDDQTVLQWDLSQPESPSTILQGQESKVYSMALSPDGQTLAIGNADATIQVWNLNKPGANPTILPGHELWTNAVVFSPDGQTLASGGASDQAVRVWDLSKSGADPITLLGHDGGIGSLAFSPDGQILASGSVDKTIRLWNLSNPESPPTVLRGHEAAVNSLAFNPDGQTLASGSGGPNPADNDNTVRVWNLSGPKVDSNVLQGHKGWIWSVAFSSDGQTLASGGGGWTSEGNTEGNTIRVWDLSKGLAELVCRKVWRNLTREEWDQYMASNMKYRATCPNLPEAPLDEGGGYRVILSE